MHGQKEKILNLLADNQFHCTSEMYAMFIADPRSRLSSLNKDGYKLAWRWCSKHKHDGNQKQWKLESQIKQCCASQFLIGVCDRECEKLRMKEAQTAMF